MACNNYYRAKLILESNKKRWLKVNPNLSDLSGIYFLHREDENGIKFGYVGQAKHLLTRLAQHLSGYQHIDLSLKKHKLYSEKYPHGYKVKVFFYEEKDLDEMERYYIKIYSSYGYQLRNKTSGGQNEGKSGIDDNKPSKGYHDGLKQGYKNAFKDIRVFFEKYLDYSIKLPTLTKTGKPIAIKKRKYEEFQALLKGEDDGAE